MTDVIPEADHKLVIPDAAPANPAAPPAAAPDANAWGNDQIPTGTEPAAAPAEPALPYELGEDGSVRVKTKVNGQDTELTLSPEDLVDRVRKGETFFQNQAQLKQQEADLQTKLQQLQGYDPVALEQAKTLQTLKTQDPARFNELVYSLNKQMTTPQETPPQPIIDDEMGKLIGKLKDIGSEKPELAVVGEIGTLFQNLSEKMQQENQALKQQVDGLVNKTGKVEQTMQQKEEERVRSAQQADLANVKAFLMQKGITQEQILSKAEAFNTLYHKGIDGMSAAQIIYEHELKTQPAGTPPVEKPFTPMSPGSAIGGGAKAKNPEAAKELEIFGRVYT